MLGDSLTMTLDGSGGTAKTLVRVGSIPGVPYSSEYFLDEPTVWYRVLIRNTTDTVRIGTQEFDRHSVTFQRYIKPNQSAQETLLGSLNEITFTIRNDPRATPSEVVDMSEAMSFYMVKAGGIAARLLGRES